MSRNTRGRLFTRGKDNRYYLQYYLNGKEIRVALKDPEGNPITKLKEALKAKDRILKTVSETDELERWKNVADKIATTEIKIEESKKNALEAEAMMINAKALVMDGFNLLLDCEHRPRCLRKFHKGDEIPRDTTIYNNHAYYKHFADWLISKGIDNLSKITHKDAFEFIEHLRSHLSSNTINKHLNFLHAMFEALIKDGKLICENPFDGLEREDDDDSYSKRPLPYEKIQEIFGKAKGELKVLFMIGYYIGMRRGDCCTLKWENVSFEREVIEKSPNKTRKRIKDKELAVVKVGIPWELKQELLQLPKINEYILPKMADLYQPSKRPQLTRMIKEVFESCGISTQELIDGKIRNVYGFHSLRYSYISRHAEIGTPQPAIQKNAGHSNPAMTEHYERISDQAAVRFANAFSSSSSPRKQLHDLIDKMNDDQVMELLKQLKNQ